MVKLIKPDGSDASTMRPDQLDCIKVLSDVLESAERGEVWSVAIVACGPNDFGTVIGGSDAPRLNLGLDVCKHLIRERVSGGGGNAVRRR